MLNVPSVDQVVGAAQVTWLAAVLRWGRLLYVELRGSNASLGHLTFTRDGFLLEGRLPSMLWCSALLTSCCLKPRCQVERIKMSPCLFPDSSPLRRQRRTRPASWPRGAKRHSARRWAPGVEGKHKQFLFYYFEHCILMHF